MKRILCILSSLDAGGAETFLMKVYRKLPLELYQFDFIVSKEGGCYTEEVHSRGGRIYAIPERTKDLAGAFCGIYSVVKENRYDVVLKLGENALAVADLIAAKLGGAQILALRSCNAPTGLSFASRSLHCLLRPLLNGIASVKLAPSELAAEFMFGKQENVHLLHNGVDLNVFRYDAEGRTQIREEFSITNNLVVGHVGQFRRQKNHTYLLEVFAKLRTIQADAVLLLVGSGELEQEIRKRAQELDIENSVIFAGQRFDIPQLLSAMDVFVFPSFHEGMPNTVIEAQATGLPCVIADTITKEANITGLVRYLALEEEAEVWAQTALDTLTKDRCDTKSIFLAQGYDIENVANELLRLLGC